MKKKTYKNIKDRHKMTKIFKICNASKAKYNLSDKKTERCVKKLKIKFGVRKST